MKSGTKRYVGYLWIVHWQGVGIMLILSPETSHILSVLPLHNSTLLSNSFNYSVGAWVTDCLFAVSGRMVGFMKPITYRISL